MATEWISSVFKRNVANMRVKKNIRMAVCSLYLCSPTLLQIPKSVLGNFPGRRIPSLSETHCHPIILAKIIMI